MHKSLLSIALLIGLGALTVAGCGSTEERPDGVVIDENEYVDDRTLEAFHRDLEALSSAIHRVETAQESALRTKIGENARRYQRALISALYDDSSRARRRLAAVMLGFTGDPAVIRPLLSKVADDDEPESVRLNAVLGLATMGDKLRDYEPHRELMAAIAVRMENMDSSYAMRRASVQAYSVAFDRAQNDSILPLRNRFMGDPDPRVQVAAVNALGEIGDPDAVPDLVQVGLGHPDHDIRAASAVALGSIEDPSRVLPALEGATNDENATVRRQAVDAISKHYGSDPGLVYATLVTGLSDFDERVRESAAQALVRVQDERAVEPLLQATGDRTAVVRRAAALALGDLVEKEDEKVVYPLVELLSDQGSGVRSAALKSLTKVTTEDFGNDRDSWDEYFWEQYPELDPKNKYADGPKPRMSSGIGTGRTGRTNTPRRNNPRRNR